MQVRFLRGEKERGVTKLQTPDYTERELEVRSQTLQSKSGDLGGEIMCSDEAQRVPTFFVFVCITLEPRVE